MTIAPVRAPSRLVTPADIPTDRLAAVIAAGGRPVWVMNPWRWHVRILFALHVAATVAGVVYARTAPEHLPSVAGLVVASLAPLLYALHRHAKANARPTFPQVKGGEVR